MNVRYRSYNPEGAYFTLIDPRDVKRRNPLLKAIDSFVDEHVSVEPFSERVNNEMDGAPAVHPRMMLKILFYSYAKGVYSSREMERMTTWIFGGANRDNTMWPELKSRFFTVHLPEYSEADFIQVCRGILIGREGVDSKLANYIVKSIASHTRDVREAVHLGRLCKTSEDVDKLVTIRWPSSRLF